MAQFGTDLGLVHEMVVAGRKFGCGEDFYAMLAHNPDLFVEVVAYVQAQELHEASRPTFEGTVDDGKDLRDLMKESGCASGYYRLFSCYDFFGASGLQTIRSVKVEFFRFFNGEGRPVILKKLEELGYRAANLREVLSVCVNESCPTDAKVLLRGHRTNILVMGTYDEREKSVPSISHFQSYSMSTATVDSGTTCIYWIPAVKI